MLGRICVVTGANSGIGKAIAMGLARRKAKVIMVCRNHIRGETAQEEIRRETGNKKVYLMLCDLASMASVRSLADTFCNRFERLDVLVNNAGIFTRKRIQTVDGYEATFAINHLSHYLLTSMVFDKLRAARGARIINITSEAHRKGDLDFVDIHKQVSYNGFQAYADSKLAQVLFTYELARRVRPDEAVACNALHPGFVATGFATNNGPLYRYGMKLVRPLQLSAEEAATPAIQLAVATAAERVTGKYYDKGQPTESAPTSYDEALARRLWDLSTKLTGMTAA